MSFGYLTVMRSGISKRSREQLARLTSRGRHLVTVDDAIERLNLTRSDAAKLLARWSQQGWLRRVRRGFTSPFPWTSRTPELWSEDPMVLATAVWSPCYFTGWTAGNHWGLTEQIFTTIVVKTTRRVRSPRQRLLDHDLLIGHASEGRLGWGIRTVWPKGAQVRIADEAV